MLKKLLIFAALLLTALIALLISTFSGAKVDFAPLTADSLPAASPPTDMTISAISTGKMESRAAFAFRGGSLGDKRDFTMTVFLVHHPKGDLIFDAGFGRGLEAHLSTEPWLLRTFAKATPGTPVGDRLAAGGYDFGHLAGVVLTHAHWDHVSGLDRLPKDTPVWVSASERQFIASGSSKSELIRSFGELNYKVYEFNGGPYLGFSQSLDVLGDGSVVLVPAPGHTPGSIVAFITLPSGTRYALLGDLVWQSEGVEIPAERPWLSRRLVEENDDEVRANIARMAAIHARFPDIRMVPAHDARAAATIGVYPEVTR
ncbi:MAG TPA: MBL fold metallo-hydrolase [Pyrinomonadaceae bacterium]|jgi:glyoxylase-like metal-dependent hydrolase (beta-lactamase superfamily II)|nr:MBL fold metallo-hydrolase [Pyrinomonadaceae bacterium]